MSHPVHLILSPGTRIVTRNDTNRIGGQAFASARLLERPDNAWANEFC